MLFCDAYCVKKMLPLDRIATANPCLGEFGSCPLFQDVMAKLTAGAPAGTPPCSSRRCHERKAPDDPRTSALEPLRWWSLPSAWCSHIAARSRGEEPVMKLSRRTFFKVNAAGAAALAVGPARPRLPRRSRPPPRARRAGRHDPLRRAVAPARRPAPKPTAWRTRSPPATMPCSRRRAPPTSTPSPSSTGTTTPHTGSARAVHQEAVHALRRTRLRLGLPRARAREDRVGRRHLHGQPLPRVPLLHGGVPVRRAEVRVPEGRAVRQEVRVLRRAPGERARCPACAEVCPNGALEFGDPRGTARGRASTRIYQNPDKYVHHVYGEHEAGGTSWLYISDVAPTCSASRPASVTRRIPS